MPAGVVAAIRVFFATRVSAAPLNPVHAGSPQNDWQARFRLGIVGPVKSAEAVDAASRFERCVFAFEQEFNYLHAVLRRNGVAAADIEDLVQEVFVVLWRRWKDFQTDRPLRPWLAGIAVNLAWRSVARQRREVPDGEMDVEEMLSPLDDRVAARSLVAQALAEVPSNNRTVLVLHDLEGVSMRAVADSLTVPLATAYTRLGRGRKAFAQAVRKLQSDKAAPALRARGLAPVGLLELARAEAPPAAPPELQRRVLARVRGLGPDHGGGAHTSPSPGARLSRGGARLIAAAGAGLLVLTALSVARRPAHPPRSSANETFASTPADRPAAPTTPLRLASRPKLVLATTLPVTTLATLSSGLAAYWRFDDGPVGHRAQDVSGRGHDCAFRRVKLANVWTDGAVGGGLRLDDTGGWISCPLGHDTPRDDAEITVATWIRAMHTKRYTQAAVTRQRVGDAGNYYLLGMQGRNLVFNSDVWQVRLTHRLPRGVRSWVHLAFTHAHDGTTRLFVDGVEVSSGKAIPAGAGAAAIRDDITLGFSRDPATKVSAQGFRGDLDELMIYDRALSGFEIGALASGAQPSSL